jgi:hypothetical protein
MRTLSRDPFARTEIVRQTVIAPGVSCAWCGQTRGDTLRLYAYHTATDGGRLALHKGLFCSKPCHDSYHA